MTPDYADYRDTPVFLALFPSCYARLVTRIARIVVPGDAHQVTQHGNRRERVFFEGVARARFETGKDGRVMSGRRLPVKTIPMLCEKFVSAVMSSAC